MKWDITIVLKARYIQYFVFYTFMAYKILNVLQLIFAAEALVQWLYTGFYPLKICFPKWQKSTKYVILIE